MPQIGYVQILRLGSAASGHSSCARDALHSQKLIAQKEPQEIVKLLGFTRSC